MRTDESMPDGPLTSRVAVAVGAGLGAAAVWAARKQVPQVEAELERTNFSGRTLSLFEGVAANVGAVSALAGLGLAMRNTPTSRAMAGAVVAGSAAALLGTLDDVAEYRQVQRTGIKPAKGLKGHLGALRRGEITTGGAKVLGIPLAGIAASALVTPTSNVSRLRWCCDVVAGGGVVAGSANLINLLDLRPGRALKAVALLGLPQAVAPRDCAAGQVAAAALGAASAVMPLDLSQRGMLGDGGANTLGALLGAAFIMRSRGRTRWIALAALAGVTIASEKVSFSAVIANTPVLRELDEFGRVAK